MSNQTKHANSQFGLNRVFGVIPDGLNAFTMHSRTINSADPKIEHKRQANSKLKEARSGLTKAQLMALALRSPEERKADRVAAFLAAKPINGFNTPIGKQVLLGTSAAHKARAAI